MTINKYFQNFPHNPSQESLLFEDLIVESIQIYGTNVFYIPRTSTGGEADQLFGEVRDVTFKSAFQIEMLITNVMGEEGPGDLFSKFGLEIRDTSRFIVARRPFKQYIPTSVAIRPREGDLLWVPALHNMYEINWVEEEKDFYSLGRRPPNFYYYELRAEQFRHSNELFQTGVAYIDNRFSGYSYTIRFYLGAGNSGVYLPGELVFQGANSSAIVASGIAINYFTSNNVLDLNTIVGEFSANTLINGEMSLASYEVTSFDKQTFDGVKDELSDNADIEEEAANNGSDTQSNPFGYGDL